MSRTRLSALALAALSVALLLAGCALGADGNSGARGTPAAADEPSRVSIPSLGVSSELLRLRRNGDGSVQVPPPAKGMTAGWYTGSAKPGTPGAAVFLGHSDPHGGESVFHDLDKVNKGTAIDVERGDGKVLRFTVTGTETVDKSAFPTQKVYGKTSERALRLVTCADGHPAQSLIVYAAMEK
jgi:LPXTG-site transpeptidase (sortase) family protein